MGGCGHHTIHKGIGSKTAKSNNDLKEKVLKLYDLDEVSMSQSNTTEMKRYPF
jgi:hypothetical protein